MWGLFTWRLKQKENPDVDITTGRTPVVEVHPDGKLHRRTLPELKMQDVQLHHDCNPNLS